MKNIQNAEDYYDDADEDSRDGKDFVLFII